MLTASTTTHGCVWESLGDGSLIFTYCDDGGTSDQWRGYLQMMQGLRGRGTVRFLIYCAAAPSRDVLGMLASAARGQTWQVALISPSTAVRFAASTFSMIVKGFRFFPPDRLGDALVHLRCDETEQKQAHRALGRVCMFGASGMLQ